MGSVAIVARFSESNYLGDDGRGASAAPWPEPGAHADLFRHQHHAAALTRSPAHVEQPEMSRVVMVANESSRKIWFGFGIEQVYS